MRIAHLCLSNFYIDDMGCQENELVREHAAAGHDVEVVASTIYYGAYVVVILHNSRHETCRRLREIDFLIEPRSARLMVGDAVSFNFKVEQMNTVAGRVCNLDQLR